MDAASLPDDLQKAVAFHGHLCPGLVIGYRAAKAAAAALGVGQSEDEELVALVENNSCSVDAFQALLSTTFGKGNLKWLDFGKQAFTLMDRGRGRAVRVVFVGDGLKRPGPDGGTDREAFMQALLAAPEDQVVRVEPVDAPPPPEARIEPSLTCACCGEGVQASRTVTTYSGETYCLPCAQREAV